MNTRRLLALLLAVFAAALLLSIPFLIVGHLRDSSRRSLGGVANGTVVAVEPDGRAFTMVVEFQASLGAVPRRFRSPADTAGLLLQRPRQRPGDPVLVAYDPGNPAIAHVFDVRSVWLTVVRRAFLSLILLVAVFLLLLATRARKVPAAPPPPA